MHIEHTEINQWKHVFKLDPERTISDKDLDKLCLSGSDAIIVGGSTGVTYDNTVDLLSRIRRHTLPCVLEVTDREAIVPGFDLYLIPIVLNAGHTDWIVGHHQQALKQYSSYLPWDKMLTEGYVILNGASTAAKMTEANAHLDEKDLIAYARMADRLFHCPIFYIEYSGEFGNMDWVRRISGLLGEARLFYGGGIDSLEKARLAATAAHTIVVGNIIYEDMKRALATVRVQE